MKKQLAKNLTVLLGVTLFAFSVNAQTKTDSSQKTSSLNHFSLGFNLNQYQHDFGVGMNLTTPYFAGSSMAIRVMGSAQWLQNIPKGDTMTTWSPYVNIRLSVVTRQFVINNKISLYSEGGVVMLIPNNQFSSQPFQFGGFGVFGFEFHPTKNWGQFIEAGGIGTGAIADKAIGRPIYSNGFLVSTGFRIHF